MSSRSSTSSTSSSLSTLAPTPVHIPWACILPILLFRIIDALSFSLIFPYISAYLASLGVPPADIGLYAGLAEGALMATEAACATGWARFADRYGRRPCVLAGSVLPVFAMLRLGFCKSAGEIILWRALWGTSPSGTLSRLMIGESTHPSNRARIMSLFAPCFNVGLMTGTLLGGMLAQPTGRLPAWLGGAATIWERWPFGLPAVAAAFYPSLSHSASWSRRDQRVFTFSYDAIFAVYTYNAVERGGLGLPLPTIGTLYSAFALGYVVITPLLLPALQARLGPARSLTLTLSTWLLIICGLSSTQTLAGTDQAAMWVVLGAQMGMKNIANMSWSLCDIINTSLFDEFQELFATACAVVLIVGALARALGVVSAGGLYSVSTASSTSLVVRQLPWLWLLALSVPVIFFAVRLRRGVEFSAVEDASDEKAQGGSKMGLLDADV
ncbi:hypothetical protein Q5752_007033 [Cryptotrichosporon argae]